jgi:ketosteroid isomerase-like protein
LDSVQSAINTVLDHHTNAINKYDLAGCGEMFTEDANIIEYGAAVKKLSGKKEIDSSNAPELDYFRQMKASFEIKWETHSLRLSGDMAYHDASLNYTLNVPDSIPMKASGNTYMAWKKVGTNQWKVQTFVFYPRQ